MYADPRRFGLRGGLAAGALFFALAMQSAGAGESAPAPAPEAPSEPTHPADIPSLLDSFKKDEPKAAETKPADPEAPKPAEEPKPVDAVKPEGEAAPVEAVPAPKIEWKIEPPEGIKIEAPQMERLTAAFDRMVAPKDDADRAAAVQDLLAQHHDDPPLEFR